MSQPRGLSDRAESSALKAFVQVLLASKMGLSNVTLILYDSKGKVRNADECAGPTADVIAE